jgi:hypothetical protein
MNLHARETVEQRFGQGSVAKPLQAPLRSMGDHHVRRASGFREACDG